MPQIPLERSTRPAFELFEQRAVLRGVRLRHDPDREHAANWALNLASYSLVGRILASCGSAMMGIVSRDRRASVRTMSAQSICWWIQIASCALELLAEADKVLQRSTEAVDRPNVSLSTTRGLAGLR